MKKFLGVVAICMSVVGYTFAASLNFDALINNLQDTYVKPLARDLGSVLAGDMYRSGRTLDVLPGIDVGVGASAVMKPLDNDVILKDAIGKKAFGLPYIQLVKGLPYGLEVTVRGFPKSQEVSEIGGGLKYEIIEKEIAAVKMGLSVMYSYNQLQQSNFTATSNSIAGIFSIKIPMVEPYIGVGFDDTKLKTDFSAAELGSNTNLSTSVSEPRYVLGFNFELLPLTFINVAATYTVNRLGADLGLGLSF